LQIIVSPGISGHGRVRRKREGRGEIIKAKKVVESRRGRKKEGRGRRCDD
jgi:hypothetical protein